MTILRFELPERHSENCAHVQPRRSPAWRYGWDMRLVLLALIVSTGCANMTDEQRARAQEAGRRMSAFGQAVQDDDRQPTAVNCYSVTTGSSTSTQCYEVAQ